MDNENLQEVTIDVTINGNRYCDVVTVNLDDNTVKLDNLDCSGTAYHYSREIGSIRYFLECAALAEAGVEGISQCQYTGLYAWDEDLVTLYDYDICLECLAVEFNGDYYYYGHCSENRYKDCYGDARWIEAPDSYWEDLYYCECCDCYVDGDYYWGDGECTFCHEENHGIIEEYSESHNNEPVFFGDYKGKFAGLGFELEVDCDCDQNHYNAETAEGLCSHCGLEENEMRYAEDGSLNYGFECISQPHTVKDFWDKQDKWRKMLQYLSDKGYKSHDPGTCGLHVHVSREMFGSTKSEQDRAIAKVFTFFDDNWDDIVKVSRRKSFSYCSKNVLYDEDGTKKTKYERWRKKVSFGEGSHGVALNNRNRATFEYRLGRGTLNAWSFFAWIDFVLTITKNAKRISIERVTSNDLLSWLGGIKESTAKYIYKRGAFRNEMLALYPNIEWETDLTDSAE